MAEKEYIEREAVLNHADIITVHTREYGSIDVIPVDCVSDIPAADVAPRAEIAEEIFNEIAKMFSEKQRSYENSHQSGKARQMMVARFEVHKLHQKYKEDHNGK